MPNELNLGKPRYGHLYDYDSTTPDMTATLERTHAGIYLSLVFDRDRSPEYLRWFTRDVLAVILAEADPLSEDESQSQPPSDLLFVDSHGTVALIGCRKAGYHTNHQIGSGKIAVGAVVFGAPSTAHAKVMGMRSEVSGLRSWLGTSAIHESFLNSPGMPGTSIPREIRLSSPAAITIPDSGLVMRPVYRLRRPNGSLIIEDLVWVEHKTDNESSWSSHQSAMRAVRDLLAVSRWRAETLVPISVARTEDSLEGQNPESDRRQWWRDVVDSNAPKPKEETQRIEHFISWDDLGADGIGRWIKLREDFSRAIDPAVSSLYQIGRASCRERVF